MTTELPGAVVPDMAVAEGAAPNPSEATPPRPEYSESMFAVMLGQYAVMQMVVAATALVRNKVIAVRLGPSAFGEIAQMAAVVASVVAITAFGMQVSLSRNVARATTQAERQAYLASANGLVLGLSLVATAALALFLVAGNLLNVVGLPVTSEVMVATGIFFAAIPLLGLQTNFLAFLQGLLDVRGFGHPAVAGGPHRDGPVCPARVGLRPDRRRHHVPHPECAADPLCWVFAAALLATAGSPSVSTAG